MMDRDTNRKGLIQTVDDSQDTGNWLLDVFDNVPLGLLIVDGEWRLRAVNRTFLRFGDYEEGDLPEGYHTLPLFMDPNLPSVVEEKLTQAESIQGFPMRVLRKGGESLRVLLGVSPLEVNGKAHLQLSFEDLSGQTRDQERSRVMGAVTETVVDSVVVTDLDFRITFLNQAFRNLYGYTVEETLGRTPDFLNAEPLADEIQEDIYQTVASGRIWQQEVINKKKDGTTFICEASVFPLSQADGEIFGYAGTQRDVTERRRLEEELSRALTQLTEAQEIAGIGSWEFHFSTGPGAASVEQYRIHGRDPAEGPPTFEDLMSQLHPEDAGAYAAAIEGSKESGTMEVTYRIFRRDDGEERLLHARSRVDYDPVSGDPLRLYGVTVDVTDRVSHEKALTEERDRAQRYLQTAEVIMVALDSEGRVEMINRKGCEVLQREEDQLLGKDWIDIAVPEEIRGEIRDVLKSSLSGGLEPVLHYENVLVSASGEHIPVAWFNSYFRDDSEAIVGVLSSGTDLTELHRAERALRESERRLSSLIDSVQAGVILQGANGEILFANEPAGEIFGMDVRDVEGRTHSDPVWEMVDEAGEAVSGSEHPSMVTLRTGKAQRGALRGLFSGDPEKTRWLLINTEPLINQDTGKVREVVVTFLDITERKRAEVALRESEERYRSLFTWMGEGFAVKEMIWDEAGEAYDYRFLDVNPAFGRLTGLGQGSVLGKTFRELLPGFEPTWVHRYGEVIRTGVSSRFSGFALPLGRHFEVQAFHLMGNRFAVTFSDITDRVGSERALMESEEKFRGIFEDSPTGISLVDGSGKIVTVNRRFCEMLGYSENELLGKDPDEFTHPYDLKLSARQKRELDTIVGTGVEEEKRYLRKDGGAVWCTLRRSTIFDEHGGVKYSLGSIQDISPRRRAEAELGESEARLRALATKLASIREQERAAVSRELHDELGQALTVLRMDLSLIHGSVKNGQEVEDLPGRLDELMSTADANIDLVRSISSRLRPPILDVMGLGPALEWQVEEHLLRSSAKFHLDISLDSGTISKGKATSLFRIAQEALTNVLRHSGAKNVWVILRKQGVSIELGVLDDGCGIQKDATLSPTALGLVGMDERALSMGGQLHIGERPGGGTAVQVRVPAGAGMEVPPQ